MKLNQKGLLIVLSGPSGVGKGTVRKALFESSHHKFSYSVSLTTRKPRVGEVDGVDYYFISRQAFEEKIKNDELLEYAEFVGNYYGTSNKLINEMLDAGEEVILEIEEQGALQVKKKHPDAVFIFIAPPSYASLKNRLLQRGTENDEKIAERIEKAHRELKSVCGYDYIVINDDIYNAADRIKAIIRAEHAKCSRSLEGYLELLEETDNE